MNDEERIERLAVEMHDVGLGCITGDWATPDGGFGRGDIADHKAQARVILGVIHRHPFDESRSHD